MKAATNSDKETELRRWCIDQAMRWPVITHPYAGRSAANNMYGNTPTEANILDRARRIYDWVKKP